MNYRLKMVFLKSMFRHQVYRIMQVQVGEVHQAIMARVDLEIIEMKRKRN